MHEYLTSYNFSNEEIELILNEIDPYFSNTIKVKSILQIFKEEVHYNSMSSINRPNEAINKIRAEVIPSKKLALQQAFVNVDEYGDGYIRLEDYLKAFDMINLSVDKQTLKYLFDCFSETFATSSSLSDTSGLDQKVISISYF